MTATGPYALSRSSCRIPWQEMAGHPCGCARGESRRGGPPPSFRGAPKGASPEPINGDRSGSGGAVAVPFERSWIWVPGSAVRPRNDDGSANALQPQSCPGGAFLDHTQRLGGIEETLLAKGLAAEQAR